MVCMVQGPRACPNGPADRVVRISVVSARGIGPTAFFFSIGGGASHARLLFCKSGFRRESYSFVYRTRLEGLSQQLQYHEKSHTQISGAWECIETNYLYPTQPTNQPASQPTSQPANPPTPPQPASQPANPPTPPQPASQFTGAGECFYLELCPKMGGSPRVCGTVQNTRVLPLFCDGVNLYLLTRQTHLSVSRAAVFSNPASSDHPNTTPLVKAFTVLLKYWVYAQTCDQ